jgi:two-component system LytT family response regulator
MPDQPPLRALVVDDEPLAREGLRLLLQGDAEVECLGEAQDGRQAAALIRRLRPDLVFLDVQMPEVDGFGALRLLPTAEWPAVIFVTAYDRYALRAFEVHAVDYLLKPFDDERFREALERAKAQIRLRRLSILGERLLDLLASPDLPARPAPGQAQAAPPSPGPAPDPGPAYLERLAIRDGGRVVFLVAAEIDWIEAADYYVEVHAGGRAYLHRESLNRLSGQLDPRRFVRIHRSALVNWDRVRELRQQGRDVQVVLRDGVTLKVARSHREHLPR